MNQAFETWKKQPLLAITKDKVAKQHTLLGDKHGEAYANLAMRLLHALFNFASGQYEDAQSHSFITENPVKRLAQTRAWYRVKPRQSYIKPHQLKVWYEGLSHLKNETLKDYLLLLLLQAYVVKKRLNCSGSMWIYKREPFKFLRPKITRFTPYLYLIFYMHC